MNNTNNSTGIVCGRFQTPYLHEGHIHLIDSVIKQSNKTIIVLGCCNKKDDRNPYTFNERVKMIKDKYPNVYFNIIMDESSNESWSDKLDSMLALYDNPILYGSRDSFKKDYTGKYSYVHIDEIPGISATKIREQLKENK